MEIPYVRRLLEGAGISSAACCGEMTEGVALLSQVLSRQRQFSFIDKTPSVSLPR